MKFFPAILATGLLFSVVGAKAYAESPSEPSASPSLTADAGPDRIKQISEPHDSRLNRSDGTAFTVRRELKRDDLAAIFALLFLGQVPRSSQAEMGAQLVRK